MGSPALANPMGWPRAFPLSLRHARIGVCASFAAGQWLLTRQLRCLYMVVPRTLCGFQYCRCCCRCRCRCPDAACRPHANARSLQMSHTHGHHSPCAARLISGEPHVDSQATEKTAFCGKYLWNSAGTRKHSPQLERWSDPWMATRTPSLASGRGKGTECWRRGSGDHGFRASVRRRAVAGGCKTATGEFLPAGVPAIQRRELPAQVLPCPRQHLTRSLATRSKSAHQATSGEWRAMDMTTTMS